MGKTEWIRPNLTKKLYDKVEEYSLRNNGVPAKRLIEKWLQEYVDKYDL